MNGCNICGRQTTIKIECVNEAGATEVRACDDHFGELATRITDGFGKKSWKHGPRSWSRI